MHFSMGTVAPMPSPRTPLPQRALARLLLVAAAMAAILGPALHGHAPGTLAHAHAHAADHTADAAGASAAAPGIVSSDAEPDRLGAVEETGRHAGSVAPADLVVPRQGHPLLVVVLMAIGGAALTSAAGTDRTVRRLAPASGNVGARTPVTRHEVVRI